MKIEQVRKLKTPFDVLAYFIQERESIRRKRALGLPPPWTDDEILGKYRFTNVRRMDDKVSLWLLNNWYKPYRNHPNIETACLLARQLNRIETLEKVGFPEDWNPKEMETVLEKMQQSGSKVFSAAYMITGTLGGTKIQQVVRKVVSPFHVNRLEVDTSSMETTWKKMVGRPGIQSFMAGQVVADLRWAMTGTWKDKNRWAPFGPGSKRGMNRLHGRDIRFPLRQEQFLEELMAMIELLQKILPKDLSKRLEAMDYQNCLCEFDKMYRTLNGEGRPKQQYGDRK